MTENTASAVKAVDLDELPPSARTRKAKPNPLRDVVKESLTKGKAKGVPVKTDDERKEAENLIKRAARELDCKVKIRNRDNLVAFQAFKG
jgi:hypothetical protein